jgi:nitric oxide reductase subunit B
MKPSKRKQNLAEDRERLFVISPWWRYSALMVFLAGLAVLTWLSIGAYGNAPPVPEKVTGPGGEVLFTGDDIAAGQSVFLKSGLIR